MIFPVAIRRYFSMMPPMLMLAAMRLPRHAHALRIGLRGELEINACHYVLPLVALPASGLAAARPRHATYCRLCRDAAILMSLMAMLICHIIRCSVSRQLRH